MNAERTFFSTSQKGKQRRRERWNNTLNVYTNDIQARHSAFRALAVNQTVPLKVDIFSWAPWKISSHCLKSKKWRDGEDTGDLFRPEGPSFGSTYANLDKVSKELSSAQSTTTRKALPTPRLQKQETTFLSSSSSLNSCKMVHSHFLMENEDQWPTGKSHPTSFHLTHYWKGLWRKTLHAGLPCVTASDSLTEDRYIWGGNRSAWANHSQILLVHSFPWVQPWEAPPTSLVMKIGILLFTLCNPENQEDKDIFPLHSSLNPWVDQNSFPPPRIGAEWGWGGEERKENFPGGPVDKSPPSNAGDTGLIPGWGTKIPHAMGQLSPRATMKTQGRRKR